MTKSSALRVAPSARSVSIWSSEIFGDAEASRVRDFLSRVFSVDEVERVELRPEITFGRICYAAAKDPAQVWRKLGRALGSPPSAPPISGLSAASAPRIDSDFVYLDAPGAKQVHVSRIGDSLTTWRV